MPSPIQDDDIRKDPRWPFLVERNPAADGAFVYGVVTTGIYCRPHCSSRLAKPENIRFYETPDKAEQAGFRPCKRCRPRQALKTSEQVARVTELCRFIENAEREPTLALLAERAGWSPYHLHRVFKSVVGVTPKAYAAAHRAERLREALTSDVPITDAIYASGYESSGRFYGESDQLLGMTPGRYRKGGAGTAIEFALGECSLGSILVAKSERGICAINLGSDPETLIREFQDRFPSAMLMGDKRDFEQQVGQVIAFVDAPQTGLDLPLDIRGTAFQRRVWALLQKISPGETLSYGEVAERIGAPAAVRAVAGACAANALAVAIPCHRVVRTDGGLSGYRWGVERKRLLLEREGSEGAPPRPRAPIGRDR